MKHQGIITILLVVAVLMGISFFLEQKEASSIPIYTPTVAESVTEATTGVVSNGESVIYVENYSIGTSLYTGELALGQPQGFGTMVFSSGEKYEGVWNNGQMHGQGEFFWTNGDVYSGEFSFGARTGYGTYYWDSGDIYEGSFREGQLYGNGVMHYRDGSIFDGVWDHGTPSIGTYTDAKGDSYEAEWVNGSLQRKDS